MVCGKWIYMRLLFEEGPVCLESSVAKCAVSARAHAHKPCLPHGARKMLLFFFLYVIFYYVTRNNWNKSSHQTNSILYHYVEGAGRIKWKQAAAFCLFSLRFFFLPRSRRPPRSTFISLPFLLSQCAASTLFSHGTTSFLQNEGKRLFTACAMYRETTAGRVCVRCRRHHDSVWAPLKKSFHFPALTCFSRFWHM